MTSTPRIALDRITELTTCTDACDPDPYAPSDSHFFARCALRNALTCIQTNDDMTLSIFPDFATPLDSDESPFFAELIDCLQTLINDRYSRQTITMLALDDSLCPLHFCDYAACFDDDDADCALLRTLFPNHDT